MMQQQMAMAIAMKGLPQDMQDMMKALQQKVMSGTPPTPQEQQMAMTAQQAIMREVQSVGPMMPMAFESLSDTEREFLTGLETKLMSNQPPTAQDRERLVEVQNSLATYVATMGPLLSQMKAQAEGGQPGAAPALD